MGLKEFLKPDLRKILVFFVPLFVINRWSLTRPVPCDGRLLYGFPLGFYPKGSNMGPPLGYPPNPVVEFSWPNLIIDIVFFYLVACGIFYIYDIIKKKYRNPL